MPDWGGVLDRLSVIWLNPTSCTQGQMAQWLVLDRLSVIWLNPTSCTQGQMAQWLEHPVCIWEVLGSNPSLVIFLIAPTCRPSKGGPSYGFPLLRSLWVAFLTFFP